MKWNSDKKILCSNCQKRPAIIKSSRFCSRCYQKNQTLNFQNIHSKKRGLEFSRITEEKYQSKAEILFGQKHPLFLYEPITFHFDGENYTPDFYDRQENIFYEVIGSRQRFHQLKEKLTLFHVFFTWIDLRIVCGDGQPYNSTSSPEIVKGIPKKYSNMTDSSLQD